MSFMKHIYVRNKPCYADNFYFFIALMPKTLKDIEIIELLEKVTDEDFGEIFSVEEITRKKAIELDIEESYDNPYILK